MSDILPQEWRDFLADTLDFDKLDNLLDLVAARRQEHEVYPPEGKLFRAMQLTPPDAVRVVILGQDPYHEAGQAEGLAFSVPSGITPPPSLRNIFKEYASDLNRKIPAKTHLGNWAANGILLINAVLSVDSGAAGSHRHFGWENVTDSIISAISGKLENKVFILWGSFAAKKIPLIDQKKHLVITSAHPSPLSAYRGFFGSRPFSQAERYLAPWQWPEL